MNRSQVRKIKNDRYYSYYIYEPYEDTDVFERHQHHIPKGSPHAPNKNEGRVIRRIMSQTGLTEAQVWQHRKYRVQIAQASNPRNGTNRPELMAMRRIRSAARYLALPTWHPEVQAYLNSR